MNPEGISCAIVFVPMSPGGPEGPDHPQWPLSRSGPSDEEGELGGSSRGVPDHWGKGV
jgi:hypothetical protein